jgi:hypothetical protein
MNDAEDDVKSLQAFIRGTLQRKKMDVHSQELRQAGSYLTELPTCFTS